MSDYPLPKTEPMATSVHPIVQVSRVRGGFNFSIFCLLLQIVLIMVCFLFSNERFTMSKKERT